MIDPRLDQVGHEDVRHEIDRRSGVAQGVEQVQRAWLRGHRQGDVDQVDTMAVDVFGNVGQPPEQFGRVGQFGTIECAVVEKADHVDTQRAVIGKTTAQFGSQMPGPHNQRAAAAAFQQQQARQDLAHDAVRHPHGDRGGEHPRHHQVGRKPVEIAGGITEQQDQAGQEKPRHDHFVPEGPQGHFGPFAGKGQRKDDERQDGIRPIEGLAEIECAADQHQHGHEGIEQDLGQRYDGKLLPEQPLVMVCHYSKCFASMRVS